MKKCDSGDGFSDNFCFSPNFQLKELRKSQNARPVLLVLSIFVLRELGGNNAMFAYSVYIFRFAGVTLDAFVCSVLVGVVRLLCAIISTVIIDRVGRRTILIPCAVLCALGEGVCGLFLHVEISGASWVPLAGMLVYVAAFGAGMGPIPWNFLGELLPTPVRSMGVSLLSFCFYVTYFGVSYAFFTIISSVGLGIMMLIFAGANFIIAAIVWKWIPESKGKTLTEMEVAFAGSSNKPIEKKNNSESDQVSIRTEKTDVELHSCDSVSSLA